MVAWKQFLRDARAAENVAPLQQPHCQAGLREICGGHQSIVSAAKNDDVVINGRHDTVSICARRCVLDSPNEESRKKHRIVVESTSRCGRKSTDIRARNRARW